MRHALVSLLALSGAACVHVPPLRPALPEQAVQGDPGAASAEAGGVRVTVHADGWRGYPGDVADYLTPVEILVENGSGEELRVGPKRFALVGPTGFRYEPMPPGEVRRYLRPYRGAAVYYQGWFGYYPWPGRPWAWRHYPYYWWGPRAVVVVPAPPPPPDVPPSPPRGTLEPGGKVALLLFFPVPANQLGSFAVEAQLVSKGNRRVAEVRLSFARLDPHAPRAAPPPAARPPAPPPQAPPPAPPGPPPAGAAGDDEADL